MLSHVFSQRTEADAGEEVDGESRVLGVVLGEETLEEGSGRRVVKEAFLHLFKSNVFEDLLEHDLDKDTRGRGGILFRHAHDVQDRPRDSITGQEMAKEAGDIAQPIRLVPMDGVVVGSEAVLKVDRPDLVELAQSLAHETVELVVTPLLGATFDDHVAELRLLALGELHLEELVHRFFKVEGGHDGDVDRPAQIDEVGLGLIMDVERSICPDAGIDVFVVLLFLIALFIASTSALFAVAVSQNLPLDLLVLLLVLCKIWIDLEDIQAVLRDEVVIQAEPVGDQVVLFDEIETFRDDWIVLELLSSDLEEDFDHVLNSFLDPTLVQDGTEGFEDTVVGLWGRFGEEGTDFAHQADRDLDTVARWVFEEEDEHL